MFGPKAFIRYAAVAMVVNLAAATAAAGDDDEPRFSINPIRVTTTSQIAPAPSAAAVDDDDDDDEPRFSINPIKNTQTSQSTPTPILIPITELPTTTTRRPQLSGWNTTIFTSISPSKPLTRSEPTLPSFVLETGTRTACPPSPVYTITSTMTYNAGYTVVPWIYQQANGTNVTTTSTISAAGTQPSADVLCGPEKPCTTPPRSFHCQAASFTTFPLSALYLVTSAWTEPARFVPAEDVGGFAVPTATVGGAQPPPTQAAPAPVTFAPQPTTGPPSSPPSSPQVPNNPQVPSNPQAPNNPQAPSNPQTPSNPQAPNNPQVPNNPQAPSNPQAPNNPQVPGSPQVPNSPQVPDAPAVVPQPPPQVISNNPIGPISANPTGPGVVLPVAAGGGSAPNAPPAILAPGAVTTINNIPVSLDAKGTQLQIGTQTFTAPQQNPNPTAAAQIAAAFGIPSLNSGASGNSGSNTNSGPIALAPSGAGILLPNGATLAPGSSTVLDGTKTFILPPPGSPSAGSLIVVDNSTPAQQATGPTTTSPNGDVVNVNAVQSQQPGAAAASVSGAGAGAGTTHTIALASLPTGAPVTLPNGIILVPGIPTTIDGVPVLLAPGASEVVVGGATITLTGTAAAATGAATGSAGVTGAASIASAIQSGISSAASVASASSAAAAGRVTSAASVTASADRALASGSGSGSGSAGASSTRSASADDYSMSFRSKPSSSANPSSAPSASAGGQEGSGAAKALSDGVLGVAFGAVVGALVVVV